MSLFDPAASPFANSSCYDVRTQTSLICQTGTRPIRLIRSIPWLGHRHGDPSVSGMTQELAPTDLSGAIEGVPSGPSLDLARGCRTQGPA